MARLLIGFRDHLGYATPDDPAFHAGVARLIADADTEYLLGAVGDDAAAVGVVQLRFRWGLWRTGGDCLVEDVFVEEAARGRGVARALLDLATARALARRCRRMELDVSEANAPALALYRSYGFRERPSPDAPRDLYMRRHL